MRKFKEKNPIIRTKKCKENRGLVLMAPWCIDLRWCFFFFGKRNGRLVQVAGEQISAGKTPLKFNSSLPLKNGGKGRGSFPFKSPGIVDEINPY